MRRAAAGGLAAASAWRVSVARGLAPAPRRLFLWIGLVLALAIALAAHAETPLQGDGPTAPLRERVVRLPGDPSRPVMLEVTIMTPDGPGPFPLAVMNHGSADPGQKPADMSRYRNSFEAFYFLSRGYAVALPMTRGFAGSDGRLEPVGCDMARRGLEDARDILAVIAALTHATDIDASHTVVAGQSFGGWNTLAVGALADRPIAGLIIFAGGVRESDCDAQDRALILGAERFGRETRAPSIWFYGDNDKLFPVETWRAMYDRYTTAGGPAELVAYGTFGEDSHKAIASGAFLKVWTPRADAFLGRLGLPDRLVYPQYLPQPPPPPSHFAAIDDVDAVPYLGAAGKAAYRSFLAMARPRAFVISPGAASSQATGFDPIARAMNACRARTTVGDCALYAFDDDVTWTGPRRAAPVPRDVARTVPAGARSALNFAYSVNPDCTFRGLVKLRVTTLPAHGVANVVPANGLPTFAVTSPYALCNNVRVTGMALTYTPAAGYAGPDTLTFEETTPAGDERVFRVAITVK